LRPNGAVSGFFSNQQDPMMFKIHSPAIEFNIDTRFYTGFGKAAHLDK
jgi:hypothetical protein